MSIKKKIVSIILIIMFVGGGYLYFAKAYPVILVDYRPISAGDLEKYYNGAYRYYQNVFNFYNKDAAALDSEGAKKEIQRAVLDKLVEDKIINIELNRLIKPGDIDNVVKQKISEINNSQNVQKGAEILYGFSADEFQKQILIPEAKWEILRDRLFLSGEISSAPDGGEDKNFEEWLKRAKSKAKVIILASGFSWNGEGVVIK